MATAANLTKHNAGGSGDNVIANGYVKSVEKVWMDNYTIAFTATKTTLDIAVLRPNQKLVDVIIMIETSASQTSGSLALGFSTDSAYGAIFPQSNVCHNLTVSTVSLLGGALGFGTLADGYIPAKLSAFQKVITGTQTTLTLQFNNWTMTTGTVKTIVRYT